jgi:hypothetical protein
MELRRQRNLVILPENRPFMLGLKYNMSILKRAELSFVYCTDNTLGMLFYKNKIAKTMIFYKTKTDQGITAIAGSLYAAMLSKLHNVPISIFLQGNAPAGLFKDDVSVLGGKAFIAAPNKADSIIPADDEFIEIPMLTVSVDLRTKS